MIRIKSQLGDNRVLTLWFMAKWVTLATINGKTVSTDAGNLYDAGQNHLAYCRRLVQIHLAKHGDDDGKR